MQKIPAAVFAAIAMTMANSPASACFINSWCSNSYSNEYGSSSCRYQRSNCDSERARGNTTPSAPSRSYGAIAYSVTSGEYGYSQQYGSRAQAERRALSECGKKDCIVAAWFYNSCGAVVADSNGNWGGAQGGNELIAKQSAQTRCEREGGRDCRVIFAHCSR